MNKDVHTLPLRPGANGDQLETRPVYVEEWLDSLPYIDFKKTSRLLYQATSQTNDQSVKPSVRMELVELYNRPYQYYIDSQVKAGAQHTLQSIETMQQQIETLKLIALNLGKACKLAADDTLAKKSLWGQSKPPLSCMHLSLNYLSHALIFSYLEYAPTPGNIWRELNFIYDFAESLGKENVTLPSPKGNDKRIPATIAGAYKRIVLAALADPHHLPYGAIWEIYEQLYSWTDLVNVSGFSMRDNPEGIFVVKLDSDSGPLPYMKFDKKRGGGKHRLLDAGKLCHLIQDKLGLINKGEKPGEDIILSPYFAQLILDHMSRAWGLPPKRKNPRKDREGILSLTCGLNAAYYFINGESEFTSHNTEETGGIVTGQSEALEKYDTTPLENYQVDKWNLVDQSSQGFAIIRNDKPVYSVRVGDLVAICYRKSGGNNDVQWIIGVIRWLMIRQDKTYKTGVQILTTRARPASIRACSGSGLDTQFRRALLVGGEDHSEAMSVITGRGLYIADRELELRSNNRTSRIKARKLKEFSSGFEYFDVQ